MKFLMLAIVMSFMAACTSASVCTDLEGPVVDYVATNGIMALCTCTSAAQVEAFVQSKIPTAVQSIICPAASSKKLKGPIGSAVCAPMINAVATLGCSQIPSCSGQNPSNAAIQALITKCSGAF